LFLDICLFFLYNPLRRVVQGRRNTKPLFRRVDEEARELGDMNSNMVLGGFLIILVCQDIVAIKAFRKSYRDGMLCAMVPGYILFYASREASRQVKPVVGWLVGLGIVLMGFMR
jgi:hypothetical protein